MGWEWHLIEEEKAMRALRKVVDTTLVRLKAPGLDEMEAIRLMEQTRHWVIKVFPDKLRAYDIIYKPRFENIYYGDKSRHERREA